METGLKNRENGKTWANVLACLTMAAEGIFFFGAGVGYPLLVEMYKSYGVFEDLCNHDISNATLNETINCAERDLMFT